MLTYLRVSDFALIDDVEIDFGPGFNVITGETGAGKTMLIGAIGLLLGDRADSLQVRAGADGARFSAAFELGEAPASARQLASRGYLDEEEAELALDRSVSREGRSRCSINGRMSSVSALAEIGEVIVEVHGQNTHQALLSAGTHLDYLDRYTGTEHLERLERYRERYDRLTELQEEKRFIESSSGDGEREIELLTHEITAIEEAKPVPGEIERLEEERERVSHATELVGLAMNSREALAGEGGKGSSARELIVNAAASLRKMAERDPEMRNAAERLESLAIEVEDAAAALTRYCEDLESDPEKLGEVESRLNLLRDLTRRFGGSLEAALEYQEKARVRLDELSGMNERAGVIESEIAAELAVVESLSDEVDDSRRSAAIDLQSAVIAELAHLELPGEQFEVSFSPRTGNEGDPASRFGRSGAAQVEFLFSSTGSGPALPLKRIASGGEMSRVMLALKIVLAGADMLPVLIFDEVDAGIGGVTAGAVGEKLCRLASFHQVFCITHLPQIAAFADNHYRVSKIDADGIPGTSVELLDDTTRADEICRMMGDSSGRKVTRAHAEDLLKRTGKKKSPVGTDP